MNDDVDGPIVSVEPGDPANDQLLAQARDDLRDLLDITIHPLIDAAINQDVDLSTVVTALSKGWLMADEIMPRERMIPVIALAMILLGEHERVEAEEEGVESA